MDNLGSDLSAIKVELVPKKKNSNGGGLTPIVADRSLDQMLDEHINRNQVSGTTYANYIFHALLLNSANFFSEQEVGFFSVSYKLEQ